MKSRVGNKYFDRPISSFYKSISKKNDQFHGKLLQIFLFPFLFGGMKTP